MSSKDWVLGRIVPAIGVGGRESERLTGKRLGADPVMLSGAGQQKGDLRLGSFLLELKSTVARSLALKLDWLLKIKEEARLTGKIAALHVSFTWPSGKPKQDGQWVLIPEATFKELVDQSNVQGLEVVIDSTLPRDTMRLQGSGVSVEVKFDPNV